MSNRAIARAAGVSLGSLTYHFRSQDEILRESLHLFLSEEVDRLADLTSALATTSIGATELVAAVEALLSAAPLRRIAKLEMYLHATRDEGLREAALECFTAYDELALAALRALDVSDAETLAPVVVAIIDGAQLRRLASGGDHLALAAPLQRLLDALQAAADPPN